MSRPLSLKIFLFLSISTSVILTSIQLFQGYLSAVGVSQQYRLAAVLLELILVLSYGIVWVGLWRGNRLAYAVGWALEFYSFYVWISVPSWIMVFEAAIESLFLALSWKFYRK